MVSFVFYMTLLIGVSLWTSNMVSFDLVVMLSIVSVLCCQSGNVARRSHPKNWRGTGCGRV